jgi:hypothetical protein
MLNAGDVTNRRIAALSRARKAWTPANASPGIQPTEPIQDATSTELLAAAAKRVGGRREHLLEAHNSMLMVAKAPHAGSLESIVDIVSRCMAFGLQVVEVHTLRTGDAAEVAHSLYPDVWINFARPAAGDRVWTRLAELFDREEFTTIFGVPYDPSMVKEGQRALDENNLTTAEFAAIWELGRAPLARAEVVRTYGPKAATLMCGSSDVFDWYRSPHPVGIQKVASSFMAFALKHDRLYDGEPTVVLNGQFALLSRLFEYSGHGAVIIELGIPENRSATAFRRQLVGHSDVPHECDQGSIRRDAADGFFIVDTPNRPVTPWANVVHASDGYLSGAIETRRLIPRTETSRLYRSLAARGYSQFELDSVVSEDPVVITRDGASRLTRLTKGRSFVECAEAIERHFPSQRSLNGSVGTDALRALLELSCSPDPRSRLEQPVPCEGDTVPRAISQRHEAVGTNGSFGGRVLARGSIGLLVPMAGSGGRFGGYHRAEGSVERIKPLLPLFRVRGRQLSALDVRAAHIRTLRERTGAGGPIFLSCNHHTEDPLLAWVQQNSDLDVSIGRVPELYRVQARGKLEGGYGERWEALSNLLRDSEGVLLPKPLGSMGMMSALRNSGTLSRWIDEGVDYVIAANSDDVGFRVDPGILGLLEASQDMTDAVIVATSVGADSGNLVKGGVIRDRVTERGKMSRYVQENASVEPSALLNTNQLYFRSRALLAALDLIEGTRESTLPFYGEEKNAKVGDEDVAAWHVYQPYCDVLRVMNAVRAVEISTSPSPSQFGAFSPLKRPEDVSRAQATIDRLMELGDVLTLPEEHA